VAAHAANFGGQRVRHGGQAALPRATGGKRAQLRQLHAQQVHLRRRLLEHREQFMDGMEMADDHDDQGFQEHVIGIDLGAATPTLRWAWRCWQAIDQPNQHDKQRAVPYHSGASVLYPVSPYDAGRAVRRSSLCTAL